jgi:hypothetical protein
LVGLAVVGSRSAVLLDRSRSVDVPPIWPEAVVDSIDPAV